MEEITKRILSTLSDKPPKEDSKWSVKPLRKQILLSLQTDEDDKSSKKLFKKAVQQLESDRKIKLSADGSIDFIGASSNGGKDKKSKKNKDKKKKKSKKRSKDEVDTLEQESQDAGEQTTGEPAKKRKVNSDKDIDNDGTDEKEEKASSKDPKNKNKPCAGNPSGVTRLFVGNLPFAVNEDSLNEFLHPSVITHIKWITDKETGKFYGSAFIECEASTDAAMAISNINGKSLMGRPIKLNYAPAREGDPWPPKTKTITGGGHGGTGQAGGSGIKAMSAKPDDCKKLFIGNLSYDIDDDGIVKFFAVVDAEVKTIRWIHHKDSGDFKGVGFVEFWNTEACEKAATLNGKNLLGRPIRIDWTD